MSVYDLVKPIGKWRYKCWLDFFENFRLLFIVNLTSLSAGCGPNNRGWSTFSIFDRSKAVKKHLQISNLNFGFWEFYLETFLYCLRPVQGANSWQAAIISNVLSKRTHWDEDVRVVPYWKIKTALPQIAM